MIAALILSHVIAGFLGAVIGMAVLANVPDITIDESIKENAL